MVSKVAINAALEAWRYYKSTKETRDEEFIIVDFTLPSTVPRLVMMDSDENVLFQCEVAHGSGSGGLVPKQFSNTPDSHMSSLGTYITAEQYTGKHGPSRRLDGLDVTNNKARRRDIVIHAANYIGDGNSGRSWGCFAVPENKIKQLLTLTSTPTILYAWSNIESE